MPSGGHDMFLTDQVSLASFVGGHPVTIYVKFYFEF